MTMYLVGGGPADTLDSVHDQFVESAKKRGTRIAIALLGTQEEVGDALAGYADPISARWPEAEIVPVWLDDEPDASQNTTAWPEAPEELAALVVAGGWTPGYLDALRPHRDLIAKLVRRGVPYLGFSAGAMVVGKRAIVGGWKFRGRQIVPEVWGEGLEEFEMREGLGLIGPAVDVHGDVAGLGSGLAALEKGEVTTVVSIDEGTCLVIDPVSGRTVVEGQQRIHWLTKEGTAIVVRHESSKAELERHEGFLAAEREAARAEAEARREAERKAAEEQAEKERQLAAAREARQAELAEQRRVEAERIEAEEKARAERDAEKQRIADEKAEAERVAAEKAEAERVAAEKAEAERVAAEKAEAERRAAEQEAERVAAEKAEAERLAAVAAAEAAAIEAESEENPSTSSGTMAEPQPEADGTTMAEPVEAPETEPAQPLLEAFGGLPSGPVETSTPDAAFAEGIGTDALADDPSTSSGTVVETNADSTTAVGTEAIVAETVPEADAPPMAEPVEAAVDEDASRQK
ncbi:hypothetical protein AAEX63_00505 [Luteococcus sp. H138]|uniref:hypothetical protein n=1 Tax=unclassified Luteococcus TaxID=2639923 RepID=UPI00313BBB31